MVRPARRPSDRPAAQAAALPFGQPAPDPEALVVGERVLQTLGADLAAPADLLRLPGRAALLREERLGVRLSAQRALLPVLLLVTPEKIVDVVDHGVTCGLTHRGA